MSDDLKERIEKAEALLALASAFEIGRVESPESRAITVQYRGHGLWSLNRNGFVWNTYGEWECEPQPSSRDAKFIKRARFQRDEAIKIAQRLHAKETRIRERLEAI